MKIWISLYWSQTDRSLGYLATIYSCRIIRYVFQRIWCMPQFANGSPDGPQEIIEIVFFFHKNEIGRLKWIHISSSRWSHINECNWLNNASISSLVNKFLAPSDSCPHFGALVTFLLNDPYTDHDCMCMGIGALHTILFQFPNYALLPYFFIFIYLPFFFFFLLRIRRKMIKIQTRWLLVEYSLQEDV